MSINATLIGQMIVFALLIWFTMRFVWPIILTAMEERETKIADGLAAAEKGVHDLELAEERASEILKGGKAKSQEYIAQAQQRANEVVEEAKGTARLEGERIINSARAEIEQERQTAKDELKEQVAKLAIAGAEQVLMREVDAAAHKEVLDKLSAQL